MVTITDNDAVESALRKEHDEGSYKLSQFREQLQQLESEYGMGSQQFLERYESGELEDKQDFMEWKALIESVSHWEEKLDELDKAS
ncbi:MAG: hypothetical protein ABEJ65_04605 [bacterium]